MNDQINSPEFTTATKEVDFCGSLSIEDINDIDYQMKVKYKQGWGLEPTEGEKLIGESNESRRLIPGTLKLIEKIIKADNTSKPYDTLVFLDKSARPACHLFNSMWNLLDEKGLLPKEAKKPAIRFLDIGKTDKNEKFYDESTIELALEKSSPKRMLPKGQDSRVLIVDEFKDTGTTLTLALQAFKSSYGVQPEGTYQFQDGGVPFWYGKASMQDVRDARLGESVRRELKRIILSKDEDPDVLREYNAMAYLSKYLSEEAFVEIFLLKFNQNPSRRPIEKVSELEEIIHQNHMDENLSLSEMSDANDRLSRVMQHLDQLVAFRGDDDLISSINVLLQSKLVLSPNDVWDFFRSAGGRFAIARREIRPVKKVKDKNTDQMPKLNSDEKNGQNDQKGQQNEKTEKFEIRRGLKLLAQLAVDKIEINMRSKSSGEKLA